MASSAGSRGGGGHRFPQNYNPLAELGFNLSQLKLDKGSSAGGVAGAGSSKKESIMDGVSKMFKSKIRKCHQDKVRGREGTTIQEFTKLEDQSKMKLTGAYNAIKAMDRETLNKWTIGRENDSSAEVLDVNLSSCLVHDSLSDKFKKMFQKHVEMAKGHKFRDNFVSFYSQAMEAVDVGPARKLTGTWACPHCPSSYLFLNEDAHIEHVFGPYVKFLRDNSTEQGFVDYFYQLFLDQIPSLEPLQYAPSSDWTDDATWNRFHALCQYYKGRVPTTGNEIDSNVSELVTSKDAADLIYLFEDLDDMLRVPKEVKLTIGHERLSDYELLFCAIVDGRTGFPSWNQLALHTVEHHPKWAVVFAKVGSVLGLEDCFPALGKKLVRTGNIHLGHLAFLLGSCDLREIGLELARTDNLNENALAAEYLLKVGDLDSMLQFAEVKKEKKLQSQSLAFLLPLLDHYVGKEDFVSLIKCLRKCLPTKEFWNSVKALVVDGLEDCLCFPLVAGYLFEDHFGAETLLRVADVDTEDKWNPKALLAVPGALHVLSARESYVPEPLHKQVVEFSTLMTLEEALKTFDFDLIVDIAGSSLNISDVIKSLLESKKYLGSDAIKPGKGVLYDTGLLLLRGIYHSRKKRIGAMCRDLESAVLNSIGSSELKDAVIRFFNSHPLVHEWILRIVATQFSQLTDIISEYPHADLSNRFGFLLSRLEPQGLQEFCSVWSMGGDKVFDFKVLESDIMGRSSMKNTVDVDDDDSRTIEKEGVVLDEKDPMTHDTRGYCYLDLALISASQVRFIACMVNAAARFMKALLLTPDEDIPRKFAYRTLVKLIVDRLNAINLHNSTPATVLFTLQAKISFSLQADQHFSQVLSDQKRWPLDCEEVNFIEDSRMTKVTKDMQELVNIRVLCPLGGPNIYSVADSPFSFNVMTALTSKYIVSKVDGNIETPNCPLWLYKHYMFHGFWSSWIQQDLIKPFLPTAREGATGPKDPSEDKPAAKNLKSDPEVRIMDTPEFSLTREHSLRALAALYGYDVNNVERLMRWTPIRRTEDGFMDYENRSLDYQDEQSFSKFLGLKLNANTGHVDLLLEVAAEDDPERPVLFTYADLAEIFTLQIGRKEPTFISFEQPEVSGKLSDSEKLALPTHPFFQVRFGPRNLCGTHYLMTMLHLDLLAKILATGQEMSAHFPFAFRDTLTNLLKTLPEDLKRVLIPIGPRKKVANLKGLEIIRKFWFQLEHVDMQETHAENIITIRCGDTDLRLNTQLQFRDETTHETRDASKEEQDPDCPEQQFVTGFNEHILKIEKVFPVIARMKELTKVSTIFAEMWAYKERLCSDKNTTSEPSWKTYFDYNLSGKKPFSDCIVGVSKDKCNCCDWVPAAFHNMKVTNEQKWEHLFGTRFPGDIGKLKGRDSARLTRSKNPVGTSLSKQNNVVPNECPRGGPESDTYKIPNWNFIDEYKVYGGVAILGRPRKVQSIPDSHNVHEVSFDWQSMNNPGF